MFRSVFGEKQASDNITPFLLLFSSVFQYPEGFALSFLWNYPCIVSYSFLIPWLTEESLWSEVPHDIMAYFQKPYLCIFKDDFSPSIKPSSIKIKKNAYFNIMLRIGLRLLFWNFMPSDDSRELGWALLPLKPWMSLVPKLMWSRGKALVCQLNKVILIRQSIMLLNIHTYSAQ